ncbi:MAG: tRNA (adenosine(37)-N6)-threonylcarbamoyltransferase complex transferase subunit TsaD [Clostridiales bacterium]|jgi:N6-L-threonylcarbamoyladenine synthase|nr:tRNA (adenosine(37)-N6)-threonylcarbamoyltransferase complex transferase subunit TsaD [Clostridiales bacterium]
MYYDVVKAKFDALKGKSDAVILGIETSCDETAAAVVRGGVPLSSVVASQIEIHRRFGGVVPEVASRNHTLSINGVVEEALSAAGLNFDGIDAIGVTYGAGLLGALLVGVSAAKGYSFAKNIPLVRVNHIEAHIAAVYVEYPELRPPFIAAVASGGHTSVIDVTDFNGFRTVGITLDDAVGEAFDKVARMLGLPYPGGPEVERLAKSGKPVIDFYKSKKPVRADLSLSYSGLKTAVVNYIHGCRQRGTEPPAADICASFTKAAVDALAQTAVSAAQRLGRGLIVLAGGVAANGDLRQSLTDAAQKRGISVVYPRPALCTDNALMVAVRAYHSAFAGKNLADLSLNAVSSAAVGE